MNEVCRLCRKPEDGNFTPLFAHRNFQEVSETVVEVFPELKIEMNDDLPQEICGDCFEIASSASILKRISLQSENFFRSQLESFLVKQEHETEEILLSVEVKFDKPSEDSFAEDNMPVQRSVPVNRKRKAESRLADEDFRTNFTVTGSSDSSWYSCNFCGAEFDSADEIMQHIENTHNPLSKICKIEFPESPAAASTSSVQMKERKTWGKYNPRKAPGSEGLEYEKIYYFCNFCDRKLRPRKHVLYHIKHKHDPDCLPHACRQCIQRFTSASELKSHEKIHKGGDLVETVFTCDICGITGHSFEGMQRHKNDDHNAENPTKQRKVVAPVDNDGEAVRTQKFHPRPRPGPKPGRKEHIYYSCSFCNKELRKTALLYHMNVKHDPEALPSPCSFCPERFDSEVNLKAHEVKHESSSPSTLLCDICGASGIRKDGMEHHILDDHLDSAVRDQKDFVFSCAQCRSRFKNKRCLQDHVRRHHGDRFKCEQCADAFENKMRLRQHVLIVHEKECRELPADEVKSEKKCCACFEEFETAADLLSHLATHRDNIKRLLCDHNVAVPRSFDEFVSHAKYHLIPKTHECLHCKKSFPFDNKFIIHVSGHKRSNVHRKISCPKCGSRFRSADELETHDKVKHRNETLFICPFCAKSFCSKSSCDSHIKFVHKNEKKFECKVCKMRFNLKSHLHRHETTHSRERPCVCELCGNSFKTKEGLGIHMKRHDGTLKKFDCSQCNYKFVSKNRLQVHMMTHSGAKPHECEFCDRAYTSKGDLVKHLQKLHVGSAVYRCEMCPEAFPRIVELREHLRDCITRRNSER